MKRVILDTNVYGELALEPALEKLRAHIINSGSFVFYGVDLIRKELRETPKAEKFGSRNLRIILLSMYDDVTKEHVLSITPEVVELAENFHKAYEGFGGLKSKSEINADFLIVSAAVLHGLDIVVSNDEKTMFAENALKAYRLIADVKKAKLPNFIVYDKFRRWFV